MLANLGCTDVSTYIQSGNAVFRHPGRSLDLSATISNSIEEGFGFQAMVMLLTADEFSTIAAANPFVKEIVEPKLLHVAFLRSRAENPDLERFPNLGLGYEALKKGGTAPAVLNASNEIAAQAFLDGQIRLSEIAKLNKAILDKHLPKDVKNLEIVIESDSWARKEAALLIAKKQTVTTSIN